MKQLIVSGVVIMIAGAVTAQPVKKPVAKPIVKTAGTALSSYNDTLSYAVGMNIAEGLKQQGIATINISMLQKGMETQLSGKPGVITDESGRNLMQRCMQDMQAKRPISNKPGKLVPGSKTFLKSTADSMGYVVGMNIGMNMQQQQLTGVKPALICKAVGVAQQKKTTVLTTEMANKIVMSHMQSLYEKLQAASMGKVNEEKAKGAAFLAENKKRPGVIETASGLQYEILKRGDTTKAKPTINDRIVANYAGTLIDGSEFDNSFKRGQPLTIGVSGVIPGWTEVLLLMHPGDKMKVYIPSSIGYGDRGAGAGIPGGATLIFEMELLDVLK